MTESVPPEAEKPAERPFSGPVGASSIHHDRPELNFGLVGRLVLAAWIAATVALFQLEGPEVLRVPVVLGFFLFVPGAAAMACAHKVDRITLIAMSIGLSLAACTSAVMVAIWAGVYSAGSLLWVVAALSMLLLVIRPLFEVATREHDSPGEHVETSTVPPASDVADPSTEDGSPK